MSVLRWGLIGCGDIARKRVAPALRDVDGSELLAVARERAELAASFAAEFGARKSYADWREMLDDGDVDAVYIATPVHLHALQTIAAAEAGKHVLCEKPMALNVKQCDEMIDACRANKVKLGVAYYRHFYPVVDRVKAVIESSEIGQPVIVQINAFEWFDPSADHPRRWLLDPDRAGGGPMFDFGCHRIEVLANIFGPPVRVESVVTNVLFPREVEDTAIAVLHFESGTCGVLCVTHGASEPQDTMDIFGSRGSIHIEVLNSGDLMIRTSDGERKESHPPSPNLHEPLIKDFVEAVRTSREPRVDGPTGRLVAAIEERIYEDHKPNPRSG
jgi:predicted dehydrogenase